MRNGVDTSADDKARMRLLANVADLLGVATLWTEITPQARRAAIESLLQRLDSWRAGGVIE